MQYPPPPPPDNQQQGYGNPYGAPPPPGSPMYPPPPPGGQNFGGGGFGGGMGGGGGDNPKGKTAIGMEANVASLIAYLSNLVCCFIPSLVFFFMEKENRFFRFHAIQSVMLWVVAFIVSLVVGVLFTVLGTMSDAFLWIGLLVRGVLGLAVLGALVMCAIKAFQGEMFKLPVIGDIADNMSKK